MTSSPHRTGKVLVVTHDTLGEKMAGPAIRALEIARGLSHTVDVKLVSVTGSSLTDERFPVEFVDEEQLRAEVHSHDVLIFQGFTLYSYPWIAESDIILVADLYDPMQFEVLIQDSELPPEDRAHDLRVATEALNLQLERADYFMCASEKQRDLWLGHLSALCRINQYTYEADPSLRSLIDVVPFGIQDADPVSTSPALRGRVPGIGEHDKIIIWGGGIYNWFDPLTLIRAIADLAPRFPDLRLFFLGIQHPNPHVPAMRMAAEAQALAQELGLSGRHVFFNQEWVGYDSRADYLLEADLGISTHFQHIETSFSFRTRILDYLWAGLPIVATQGDSFADIIAGDRLGVVVPHEDANALGEAIERALYSAEHAEFRRSVASTRERFRWSTVLEPLIAFCSAPRHAADYPSRVRPIRELERKQLRELVEVLSAIREQQDAEIAALKSTPLNTGKIALTRIRGRFRRPKAG